MTYGSLFSGIGGLDLGLDRAGFQCKWQVEIDPYALKVLEKHWPNVTRYGDITKLTGDELEPVDLLCGGFPCQDLSQAGKQAGIEGTRSGLWFEYARLVGILRPRYVLIENVPGLLIHDAMRRVIGELARLGYVGIWRSLRASEFGVSHLRKRVFIVAYLEDSARHEQPGREGEDRRMRRRGVCVPGESLAHGDDGRREIERRGGLFDGERKTRGYDVNGCDQDVAHGPLGGLGIMRQPSGSNGLVNGSHEELGDTECSRRQAAGIGRHEYAGREPQARRGELADSLRKGLEVGDGKRELQIRGDTSTIAPSLPSFAPGPSSPLWPLILRERPDLAPALANPERRISGREPAPRRGQERRDAPEGRSGGIHGGPEETPQSPLCGMADGISSDLDRAMSNRTKRLGRLGNAVVPQISEWIGRRIMEFEEVYA